MKRMQLVSCVSLPLMLVAVPGFAQVERRLPTRPAPTDRSAVQISMMEGALQRTANVAGNNYLNGVLPPFLTLEGGAEAFGFKLDGYGLFFHVVLPPLPRSIMWSIQNLAPGLEAADIESLRQIARTSRDPVSQKRIEDMARRLEARVSTPASGGRDSWTRMARDGGEPTKAAETTVVQGRDEPFAEYTLHLQDALAAVILDLGPTIALGASDWLTVCARETPPVGLGGATSGGAMFTLRIRASDLTALRERRITVDEARKRIELK